MFVHRRTQSMVMVALVASAVFLAGCDQDVRGTQPEQAVTAEYQGRYHAWMASRLPYDALAYMRLPGILHWLTGEADNAISPGTTHGAYQQIRDQIWAAFDVQVNDTVKAEWQAVVRLALGIDYETLEVAILPSTTGSMMPNAWLSLKLRDQSKAQVDTWLKSLEQLDDTVSVRAPLDDEGFAKLQAGPLLVHLHYNPESQILQGATGISATPAYFRELIVREPAANPLYDFESALDGSASGPVF